MKKSSKGFLFAIAAALLFATMPVATRFVYSADKIDPLSLLAVRALIGALVLWIFRPRKESILPVKREWPWLLLTGGGLLATSIVYFYALQTVPAATAVLLSYTYPAFTALVTHFWFGEPLGIRRILALVLTFAGTAALLGWSSLGLAAVPLGGLLLALCTGVTYTAYAVGGQQLMRNRSSSWTNRWATTGIAVILLFIRPPHILIHSGWPLVLGALYLGLAITLFAGTMFLSAVRQVGAAKAGLYATVEPLFTAVLAFLVLGEGLGWGHLIGGVLVLTGVLWLEGLHDKEESAGE